MRIPVLKRPSLLSGTRRGRRVTQSSVPSWSSRRPACHCTGIKRQDLVGVTLVAGDRVGKIGKVSMQLGTQLVPFFSERRDGIGRYLVPEHVDERFALHAPDGCGTQLAAGAACPARDGVHRQQQQQLGIGEGKLLVAVPHLPSAETRHAATSTNSSSY